MIDRREKTRRKGGQGEARAAAAMSQTVYNSRGCRRDVGARVLIVVLVFIFDI